MKNIEIDTEILELERIDGESGGWPGIYTLGLQSHPRFLTVKSQQRRARQLADSLFKLFKAGNKVKAPRIAIIGGGFGGLTLAACLIEQQQKWPTGKKGAPIVTRWEISVFERQNQLVPIQRGCSIRKLHPAIHTWPATDCFANNVATSANPDKLLYWSPASAEVVAAKFVDQVLLRHREVANTDRWDIVQSAKVKVLKDKSSLLTYQLMFDGQRIDPSSATPVAARGSLDVDVVVFATGFGVECSDSDKHVPVSYWRNDDLGQAPLYGQKQRFVISGAGDGALTDLFRLCLYDFSYDVLMQKILPVEHSAIDEAIEAAYKRVHPGAGNTTDIPILQNQYKTLLAELLTTQRTQASSPPDVFAVLENCWNQGGVTKNKIEGQALGYLAQGFLAGLCKQDVQVIVQVLPKFADADLSGHPLRAFINNPKSMLYNRVMAYLLWRVGAFETMAASSADEVIKNQQWEPNSVKTIVRHGAEWTGAVLETFTDGPLKSAIGKKLNSTPALLSSPTVQAYQLGQLPLYP